MYAIKIEPGSKCDLKSIPTSEKGGMEKDEGEERIDKLEKDLEDLQELHYAAGGGPLLIVLQGRDTAGKDGTIRRLFRSMNAQSTRVASFKVPTPKELAHDYMWRIHQETPGKAETVIFNRSHYEDVLVVRVHDLVPEEQWKARYGHINDWEKMLTDTGTTILKFCLHISPEEQEQRLLDREKEDLKAWKLNVGDWQERTFWDEYTKAYNDALTRCSTEHAPWYVIPADHKWFRDLAVLEVVVKTMQAQESRWRDKLKDMGETAKTALAEYRSGKQSP